MWKESVFQKWYPLPSATGQLRVTCFLSNSQNILMSAYLYFHPFSRLRQNSFSWNIWKQEPASLGFRQRSRGWPEPGWWPCRAASAPRSGAKDKMRTKAWAFRLQYDVSHFNGLILILEEYSKSKFYEVQPRPEQDAGSPLWPQHREANSSAGGSVSTGPPLNLLYLSTLT